MKARGAPSVESAGIAATLALFMAAAAFLALSAVARPHRYEARLSELRSDLAQARTLREPAGGTGAYGPKALCRTSPDQAALELRRRLQAPAVAGVAVADLIVEPGPTSGAAVALISVQLQFRATGGYDAIVGLLGALAKSRPVIFIDNLDLRPDGANTVLQLSGRVLCAPSARP